jgi:hypothetical protein
MFFVFQISFLYRYFHSQDKTEEVNVSAVLLALATLDDNTNRLISTSHCPRKPWQVGEQTLILHNDNLKSVAVINDS